MKYIDAEKLKKEIENLKIDFIKFHTGIGLELVKSYLGYRSYDNVLSLIDSLQQERPSLPPNLDETAEKYAQKEYPDEPSCGQWGTGDYEPPVDMEYPREIAKDAFKAGAEWMARQMKQKQPEVEFEDKFAKFIEKKDAELGANTWSEEDLRELALYFYYGRNDDNQPEVDLEKEIEWEWVHREKQEVDLIECAEMDKEEFARFARHFYELGKNSK